jgi:hypothetical protein
MSQLLTRDKFREGVFKRDGDKCVICGEPGQDAHHIMERRLFPNGGYYLDNGATLCGTHHIEAEETTLTCEQIREAAGITYICIPPHLYPDERYDKWGNPYMKNGTRLRGDLYNDPSVQKIIKGLFSDKVKYPRTFHLPWSLSKTKDDKTHATLKQFLGREIVATEKMDGECTTIGADYLHARSVDAVSHWTQSWVRNLQGRIGHELPAGHRICGENVYAKHSIEYKELDTFFYIFSMWDDQNMCLSWDDTVMWSQLLDIPTAPVIYRGVYDNFDHHKQYKDYILSQNRDVEGYVMRVTDPFHYSEFKKLVGKFVRKDHVNEDSHHWKSGNITLNTLKC